MVGMAALSGLRECPSGRARQHGRTYMIPYGSHPRLRRMHVILLWLLCGVIVHKKGPCSVVDLITGAACNGAMLFQKEILRRSRAQQYGPITCGESTYKGQ